ncbi:MAG: hypothetical protein HY293_08475 [Planctomycetes bacterium]|nr:hypothetical protein [Planctomycetota bacterium]
MRRAAALLILVAGCAPVERRDEPEIRVVAVLPFADQTGGSGFDADEFANILASELVKLGGIRVIRPAQIRATGEAIASADDAIRIGRRVRADAVLACAITDYDPYDPPRIAVSAQFLRVAAGPLSGQDLDRLLQSGSWHRGPLTLSRDRAGHALIAFEEVYDSREKSTRHALREFAEGRVDSERELLAVQSRYLQFVSNRMISRMLAHGS